MKSKSKQRMEKKDLHPSIIRMINRIQSRLVYFAEWLQRGTQRYSSNQQKGAVVLFCLVGITSSSLIILVGLQKRTLGIARINLIAPMPLTNTPASHSNYIIPKE